MMIDRDRIMELEEEVGHDDLHLILMTYFEEATVKLAAIAHGLAAHEQARAIHFLRSGALNMGLSGMVRATAQCDEDPDGNPDAGEPPCAIHLGDVLERTREALAQTARRA